MASLTKALQENNKNAAEITKGLKKIHRVLETLNTNLVQLGQLLKEQGSDLGNEETEATGSEG